MLLVLPRRGLATYYKPNKFLKTPIKLPPIPTTLPRNLQLIDPKVLKSELPFQYELGTRLTEKDLTLRMYYGPFTPGLNAKRFPEPFHLAPHVFQTDIRPDVMSRVVRWQRNLWQQGTHKTKTKGEVSGRNKKPYAQKGSGNARQGMVRNPHMRGGGVAHGPIRRSHAHKMNRRERRLGLRSALAARFQEGQFFVCNSLNPGEEMEEFTMEADISQFPLAKKVKLSSPLVKSGKGGGGLKASSSPLTLQQMDRDQRTDHLALLLQEFCAKLGLTKVLILDSEISPEVIEAIKKVSVVHIDYQNQAETNVYEILHKRQILISKPGLERLQQRLDEGLIRSDKWKRKGFVEFLADPETERPKSLPNGRHRMRLLGKKRVKELPVLSAEMKSRFDQNAKEGKCIICGSAGHHSDQCVAPGSTALWSEAEAYCETNPQRGGAKKAAL